MKRYEYHIVPLKSWHKLNQKTLTIDQQALDLLGREGWRIIAHSTLSVIFIREMSLWKRLKLWHQKIN